MFLLILIYLSKINYSENALEYTGTTELYNFLLRDYDKRVDPIHDGNLTNIYQALDVMWLNKGTLINTV